jgi:hypothetical protein
MSHCDRIVFLHLTILYFVMSGCYLLEFRSFLNRDRRGVVLEDKGSMEKLGKERRKTIIRIFYETKKLFTVKEKCVCEMCCIWYMRLLLWKCIHMSTHVIMEVHIYAPAGGVKKLTYSIIFNQSQPYFLRQSLSLRLNFINLARIPSRSSLFLPPQCRGYRSVQPCLAVYMGCYRSKLRSFVHQGAFTSTELCSQTLFRIFSYFSEFHRCMQ